MKTYRNERLGFRIDVPVEWALPVRAGSDGVIFRCGPGEDLNIIVGPLPSRSSMQDTERQFTQYAQERGYDDLELGRILVGGKNHIWARYRLERKLWYKKYLIVFGGMEYAITATCHDQWVSAQKDGVWDAMITTFRLLQTEADELDKIMAMVSQPTYPNAMSRRVDLCERALGMTVREADPELWASLQEELSKSLLGDSQGDRSENLEQAIHHSEQALEVFTRQAYPREGPVYTVIWHPCTGIVRVVLRDKNIEQAIFHCHQALEVYIREGYPEQWATAHNNLANVYRDCVYGDRTENLEQAIAPLPASAGGVHPTGLSLAVGYHSKQPG